MSPEEYDKYLMGQYTDMQKVIQDSYGVDMPSMDELNKMSDDELMDYFDAKGINLDDVMGGFQNEQGEDLMGDIMNLFN